MIIRQATIQDTDAIKRLIDQLGYSISIEHAVEKIKTYTKNNYNLLVAELNGMVVGSISLHWFDLFHSPGLIGRISAFCVDEPYRSKDIGRQLLIAAESFLAKQGCTKIEVTSNIKRIRAHEFYLNRGYAEDSRRFTKYLKQYD